MVKTAIATNYRPTDIGYGYLKELLVDGKVAKTRAVVGALGTSIVPSTDINADVITVDGVSYVVGDDVYRFNRDEILANESVNRAQSLAYKVLALYSLAKRHVSDDPVTIITGLPYLNLEDERSQVKDLLDGTHEVVFNGSPLTINVAQTVVVAQGIGTFFTLVKQRGDSILKKRILIVDLGFRTGNYLPINSGEVDAETVKTARQLGIQSAYIEIAREISKEFKRDFNYYDVDNLLDNGVEVPTIDGKQTVDISEREYVRKHFTKYAEAVWADILAKYDDDYRDGLDEIVFAGGTAERVQAYLYEARKNYCSFIENSQDAQVLGYGEISARV